MEFEIQTGKKKKKQNGFGVKVFLRGAKDERRKEAKIERAKDQGSEK